MCSFPLQFSCLSFSYGPEIPKEVEVACQTLAAALKLDGGSLELATLGFPPCIKSMVSSHSPTVSAPALELLAAASAHASCRRKITEAGMLSAVVVALQSKFSELLVNAAKIISNLARDKDMQTAVAATGIIPTLIGMLSHPVPVLKRQATIALGNLSVNDSNEVLIVQHNALPPLLHILRDDPLDLARHAARVLVNLSVATDHKRLLVELQAIPLLCSILAAPVTELTQIVCRLVANVSCAADAAEGFVQQGVVRALSTIIVAAQLAAAPSPKLQACAGAALLALHVVVVQAAAGDFLMDSGIDWEQWADDSDERIVEAVQSLVDITRRSAISQQPQHVVLKPILPMVETETAHTHVIPSPRSSRAASPVQPPSSSRANKLPSKQVQNMACFLCIRI